MSDELDELREMSERVSEMRAAVVLQVNEVFAALKEVVEGDNTGGLVRVAEKFERERDQARAQITQLSSGIQALRREVAALKAAPKVEHMATIKDAAVTLRNAMKGVTEMPLTSPGAAGVIGQVNKAVVVFDEATKGML